MQLQNVSTNNSSMSVISMGTINDGEVTPQFRLDRVSDFDTTIIATIDGNICASTNTKRIIITEEDEET